MTTELHPGFLQRWLPAAVAATVLCLDWRSGAAQEDHSQHEGHHHEWRPWTPRASGSSPTTCATQMSAEDMAALRAKVALYRGHDGPRT